MAMNGAKTILILLLTTTFVTNTSSTSSPEDHQPIPCNNCCQGPVGVQGQPGIPGIPGSSGIPGNLGPKGEPGESVKGDRGESIHGEIGPAGEKGDVGSLGPRGKPGVTGPRGPFGFKGQKGERGRSHVSAFSAVRSSSFIPTLDYQSLPFDNIDSNIGGDFDTGGRFTCGIAGIYLFTYSVATYSSNPHISLMKNTVKVNTVYRSDEGLLDIVSNSAVLQLEIGDQVWLQCRDKGREIYSNGDLFTTFSGVILHET